MAEKISHVVFQCTRCDYKTNLFGEFMNHPCQERQLAQQHRLERRMHRIKIEQFLFCPVCGSCRRKSHEVARRDGTLGCVPMKDHCLMCWTHYDQDWSFLEKIFVLPWGYTLDLCCPENGCTGELRVDRDAFWPTLEWIPGRRKRERPIPQLKRKQLYRTCDQCQRPIQPHHLLSFPRNRLQLLSTLTAYQKYYEMQQLRQLAQLQPTDERVSPMAWTKWSQMWEEREAQVAWEVQHGGIYVPYPDPSPTHVSQKENI